MRSSTSPEGLRSLQCRVHKGGHRDLVDAFSNGANHCAVQETCSAGHQASSEEKDEVCSLS